MESVEFSARIVEPGQTVRRVEAGDPEALVGSLPLTKPIAAQSVRMRADDLLPLLNGVTDPADVLTALRSSGVVGSDAQTLAVALGTATSAAEIVAVDDENNLLAGAVGVFCSPRGDVVSIPSTAADGGEWITLAPATERRIVLGCDDLAQRRRAVR